MDFIAISSYLMAYNQALFCKKRTNLKPLRHSQQNWIVPVWRSTFFLSTDLSCCLTVCFMCWMWMDFWSVSAKRQMRWQEKCFVHERNGHFYQVPILLTIDLNKSIKIVSEHLDYGSLPYFIWKKTWKTDFHSSIVHAFVVHHNDSSLVFSVCRECRFGKKKNVKFHVYQ